MSLLGELHQQAGSGTCYATTLANFVHLHMPQKLLRELKSLMEGNHLDIRKDSTVVRIPLNTYTYHVSVQLEYPMPADGRLSEQTYVHEIPGMYAALRALGIQAGADQQIVTQALGRLQAGADNNLISCQQVIENIAKNSGAGAGAGKRIAAAIDAFTGAEDVRLLRVWEHTVASASRNGRMSRHNAKLRKAIIEGTPINKKADPHSLMANAEACRQRLSGHDRRYRSTEMDRVLQEFRSQIDALMDDRLQLHFDGRDLNIKGTFVLHELIDPANPISCRAVENAIGFKQVMGSNSPFAGSAARNR